MPPFAMEIVLVPIGTEVAVPMGNDIIAFAVGADTVELD